MHMFTLARAVTYATLFIGFRLVFLPLRHCARYVPPISSAPSGSGRREP
jgi:hypothetical protein